MNFEKVASIAAVAVAVIAMLGFLWSIKSDIVGVHEAIADVHRDMAGVHQNMGELTERIAKIEIFVDWFKEQAGSESLLLSRTKKPSEPESCESG